MKKTFALILVGVLFGSTAAFGLSKLFSDVPDDAWYTEAVENLSEIGIIKGYPDQTFRPGNNVNRAELAVMIDRLMEYNEYNLDPFPIDISTPAPGATLYYVCKSEIDNSRIYKTTAPYPDFEGEFYNYKGEPLISPPDTKDCQRTTEEYFLSRVDR